MFCFPPAQVIVPPYIEKEHTALYLSHTSPPAHDLLREREVAKTGITFSVLHLQSESYFTNKTRIGSLILSSSEELNPRTS